GLSPSAGDLLDDQDRRGLRVGVLAGCEHSHGRGIAAKDDRSHRPVGRTELDSAEPLAVSGLELEGGHPFLLSTWAAGSGVSVHDRHLVRPPGQGSARHWWEAHWLPGRVSITSPAPGLRRGVGTTRASESSPRALMPAGLLAGGRDRSPMARPVSEYDQGRG